MTKPAVLNPVKPPASFSSKPRLKQNPRQQALHLWVQHGIRMSKRSARLISKWNSYHIAARNEHKKLAASFSISPAAYDNTLKNKSLPSSRLTVNRNEGERRTLRNLRRLKIELIAKDEEEQRRRREKEETRSKELELFAKKQAERSIAVAAPIRAPANIQAAGLETAQLQQNRTDKQSPLVEDKATSVMPSISAQRTSDTGDKSYTDSLERKTEAPQQPPKNKEEEYLLKQAEDGLKVWKEISTEAEEFRNNPAMKKGRLILKKRVNLAVNQIAASVKQVWKKVVDLTRIVSETKASQGILGESFVMKMIAQRLIAESDGSAALCKTTAFAVASVIVGLTASVDNYNKFRYVFLGAFYDHCMYTIPRYAKRRKGESAAEYKERIGYKEDEDSESYLERMCGCMNLFGAVVQTEGVYTANNSSGARNPFPLSWGWCVLARLCNKEQRSITPSIVYALLEVAGYRLSKEYGMQFKKLMLSVHEAVVKRAVKSAPKGPTTRLQILIEEFQQAGFVIRTPPEGRILPRSDAENM
ncbi:Nucleoporin GLE1 [Gracilariopsis chorda]|uniref:mRNA export factor GLE1 n=1 Tax=Gracilariopsis chorda TaxID=448386 RepID=A0A2V3IKJ7_9FLOR|nr:Nucleoporin GLE1 [Gracilariopsis chorda]|eukprot:PXF42568.1 Nucleoporin GLE1 [Gracilariopsis chorda]